MASLFAGAGMSTEVLKMYPSLLGRALLMKHSLISRLLQLVDISTHSSISDADMLKLLDTSGTNISNVETNVSETWNGTLNIGKEKKHQCLREKTGSKDVTVPIC